MTDDVRKAYPALFRGWRREVASGEVKPLPLFSGTVALPLYRMRDLPKPFTISDQDRHGTG